MTRPALASFLLLCSAAVAAPLAAQGNLPRLLSFEEAIAGSEEHEVRWPVAVAAASAEEIAVADAWQPRLLVFRKQGVSWLAARQVALPAAPAGLAWDGSRYLVTLRGGEGLVALEGAELLQRRVSLPAGSVPGPLAPWPGGGAIVFDVAGGRVVKLGGGGEVEWERPVAGHVTGLAAGPGGGFYTAVGELGQVRRYDAAGQLEGSWELPGDGPVPAWPSGVAVEPGGDALVVDRHNGRILVLDASGKLVGVGSRKGWEPGLLLFPAGIGLAPDGRVLVADLGNGRAQLFRRSRSGGS